MRLLVDQGLRVMDITKAALLRLRIIKLRLQYNGKIAKFDTAAGEKEKKE